MLWIIGSGLVFSILGGIAAMIVVVKLPKDYFSRAERKKPGWHGNLGKKLAKIGKNIAGVLLIAGGIVLLFPGIPGPGVVIVLFGLAITDIPGKHKLVVKIAKKRFVMKSMNKIRRRFGRPDLLTPHAA